MSSDHTTTTSSQMQCIYIQCVNPRKTQEWIKWRCVTVSAECVVIATIEECKNKTLLIYFTPPESDV